MWIITGVIKSTNIQWLQVLANIAPPDIRRYAATDKMVNRIENFSNLPVYNDVFQTLKLRLKSRHPIWTNLDGVSGRKMEEEIGIR